MKKSTLPDREKLKNDRSPYLDVEIAASREAIDRGIDSGYRLKTIWRSLCESGDITGSYSGFVKAYRRNGGSSDYSDEYSVRDPVIDTRKNRSERESEAAMAEAKEFLKTRAVAK